MTLSLSCVLLSGGHGLQYQGCYKDKVSDPDLNVHLETSASLNPSLCAERCKAAGQNYVFSSVQFNTNVRMNIYTYMYAAQTGLPFLIMQQSRRTDIGRTVLHWSVWEQNFVFAAILLILP